MNIISKSIHCCTVQTKTLLKAKTSKLQIVITWFALFCFDSDIHNHSTDSFKCWFVGDKQMNNINYLIPESEVVTAKSLTEALPYWPSDSEVNTTRFPVTTERSRLLRVRFFWEILESKNGFCVFLAKCKNGSWIRSIHTRGGYFGLNLNPDFWDSSLQRFLGERIWKN